MRDPRYDVLFEPVRIGPLTARNRFYQVPHCNGMASAAIHGQIRMREIRAEGGWAVVNTEFCSASPESDCSYPVMTLWDDEDVKALALIAEAVHRHGALMGVQIGDLGAASQNLLSREAPRDVVAGPGYGGLPTQTRAMDKADIREFLRRQRTAARRARQAGCDIVYADAGGLSPPLSFISRRMNQRSDEYGGSLENRVRLLREMIEVTREGAGPDCAVAVRICVDELMGPGGLTSEAEGRETIGLVGELPDLWDVNVSDWENDSRVSRFAREGSQEPYVAFVKQLTSKPVVGVGRFTSPDTMVAMIRRGILDFIGAARPGIADPFLPRKIEDGRIDDIRECIGCNVCVSGFLTSSPIRCTQNPTMGEEYRRGWHPEFIAPRRSEASILVVGGGPAGLECATALGKRGYQVILAEASRELGGRVVRESRLPGLSEWIRVRDYRVGQIGKLRSVETYLDSVVDAAQVLELGVRHVVLATGARWQRDGIGAANGEAVPGWDRPHVITPDEIMDGAEVRGPVLVFDDDHYYIGNVIAEKLRSDGHEVTLVTPAPEPAGFCHKTLEHRGVMRRLYERGVGIVVNSNLAAVRPDEVDLVHVHSGASETRACATLVMVTLRQPRDELCAALEPHLGAQLESVRRIGDCYVPSTIAAAVWWGHRYAREFDEPPAEVPFLRERTAL